MTPIKLILIFILSIIAHEFGHWVAFRLYGFRPNIKINWFGFTVGENCYYKTKPYEAYVINLSGILIGIIPLVIYDVSLNWLLVYLITCSIDINNIFDLLSIPYKKWNRTLNEIIIEEVDQLKKKRDIIKNKRLKHETR